jgi:hypothetical protein
LKAAKKQSKDLDEDDMAYLEKKKAGRTLRTTTRCRTSDAD